MDSIPPAMRPKGKRKVYQSISSAFSRMSSPRASSLEMQSASIAGTLDNLPGSPRKKRQRIYSSLSSAFSRRSPSMANSPQPMSPSPVNLPEIFIFPPSPSPAPEEGDNIRMIEEDLGPVVNEEEVEGGGSSPRPELEIDEPETAPAPGPAQL
jgi:hypothetical protein